MPESSKRKRSPKKYVQIVRTGAFLLALDMHKPTRIHMGGDIHKEGNPLTLPGGNIEKSDRNLYEAALRETRQELGAHLNYRLIDPRPIVTLHHVKSDRWIRYPKPGQKVKLRVAFIVMEVSPEQRAPRESGKREVLNPKPYHIPYNRLVHMNMRESSRAIIKTAYALGVLPQAEYRPFVEPDFRSEAPTSLENQMKRLLIPPATRNYHCMRKIRYKKDRQVLKSAEGTTLEEYLQRLDKAVKEHKSLPIKVRSPLSIKVGQLLTSVAPQAILTRNEGTAHLENLLLDLVAQLQSRGLTPQIF